MGKCWNMFEFHTALLTKTQICSYMTPCRWEQQYRRCNMPIVSSHIFLTIWYRRGVRYTSMYFVESVAVCALRLGTRAKRRKRFRLHPLLSQRLSGFGGLEVACWPSVRTRQKPSNFSGRKYPQHAFLRRGSKAVGPISQICGM
jgi:hypothetical protein